MSEEQNSSDPALQKSFSFTNLKDARDPPFAFNAHQNFDDNEFEVNDDDEGQFGNLKRHRVQ